MAIIHIAATCKSLAACITDILYPPAIYQFKHQLSIRNTCLILNSSPPLQINQAYSMLNFIEAALLKATHRLLCLKRLHFQDDRKKTT